MSANTDISKLDDLIVTTIDSVKGYEHAAEHAEASLYSATFLELGLERRDVVLVLQDQSRTLGGSPSDFGSADATLHRRFEDLRRALGGGVEATLTEIDRGENYLREEFERAMKDDAVSPETRVIIDRCYATVKRGHDKVGRLRDLAVAN